MVSAWFFLSIFLVAAYAAVLSAYWRGWRRIPVWTLPPDFSPRTRVTVVIPARNEADYIGACLRSILDGTYPPELLEIIVVDDFSDDETAEIVRQFANACHSDRREESEGKNPANHFSQIPPYARNDNPRVKLLALYDFIPNNSMLNSHKKRALEVAIARASGELIVTTDADCVAPRDWLRLLASVFETVPQAKIVAAPVAFHRERNLLQRFQALDFLGLMGITGAGIQLGWQRLGNGANLAYPKAVFETLGGFEGIDGRASGDDLFLLQKAARRWPDGVFFLKNAAATVLTEARPDWRSFFRQRLRWGTKNAALPEAGPKIVLLLVFCFCWSIVLNAVFGWFLGPAGKWLLLAQLAIKAIFDFIFLREMCRFFRREDLLRCFVPAFFLHTGYIAVVGTASLFVRQYEWKGRRVR